ncbi:MAG: hypothetical protein H0U76_18555 [Ktedonobacteraceae bacterium]|nr:hypothetical protein [Ktedonobacteraceae bacterium]
MTRRRISQGSNTTPKAIREYSNVSDFLAALTGEPVQIDVLLAPVYRPLYSGTGTTRIQAGVMLNAQRPGYQRIYSCIALAAEASLIGERGRLTYPPRGTSNDASVRQHIHDLQRELLAVLGAYLHSDMRIRRIRQPESLWVPTTRIWSPNALLGLPIAYQDGHWRVTSGPPEP